MTIPLNIPSILNAVPFQGPRTAIATNFCKQPDQAKIVPMQFVFAVRPSWQVDLSTGTPNAALEQLSALYVDASQSTHDIAIIIPATGFQIVVGAGKTAYFPVLTGKDTPPLFYVVLNDNGATNATDICNVFAMNFFIPGFTGAEFNRVVTLGYGAGFELLPNFTQSQVFCYGLGPPNLATPFTLITATQWFITGIFIRISATFNAPAEIALELRDGTNQYYQIGLSAGAAGYKDFGTVIEQAGLNGVSNSAGNLTAVFNTVVPLTTYNVSITIQGGILIP